MARHDELLALWRNIQLVGSIQAYVQQVLTDKGYLGQRRNTDKMSERELDEYKKQLKAEAEERRKVRKEAWLAFRESHIVHLGEGVFWTDKTEPDRWDLPNAEERAAENELPKLDTPQE